MEKGSKEWKKYRREIARKHRAAHPEKRQARRAGEVLSKKPCEYVTKVTGIGTSQLCGELKVEAHHDDYKKPWKVRWLCKTHHEIVDTEIDRRRRGV